MDNSNPEVQEGKGNEKIHSQNSGTGREWKKSIPKMREWEGNEKIHSQNSGTGRNEKIHSQNLGTGIRGYYSREWTGTGTGTGMERKDYDDLN